MGRRLRSIITLCRHPRPAARPSGACREACPAPARREHRMGAGTPVHLWPARFRGDRRRRRAAAHPGSTAMAAFGYLSCVVAFACPTCATRPRRSARLVSVGHVRIGSCVHALLIRAEGLPAPRRRPPGGPPRRPTPGHVPPAARARSDAAAHAAQRRRRARRHPRPPAAPPPSPGLPRRGPGAAPEQGAAVPETSPSPSGRPPPRGRPRPAPTRTRRRPRPGRAVRRDHEDRHQAAARPGRRGRRQAGGGPVVRPVPAARQARRGRAGRGLPRPAPGRLAGGGEAAALPDQRSRAGGLRPRAAPRPGACRPSPPPGCSTRACTTASRTS